MRVEFEFWQLIASACVLVSAFYGLVRLLLWQFARGIEQSITLIRSDSQKWVELERRFLNHLAELPVQYVRREDYVRGQTVIEAKLDAIASELKAVQIERGKS